MCQALREIMKDDFEQAEARGVEIGRAEGLEKVESKLGMLMDKLFSLGRLEDAQRCAKDPEYRRRLYQEFKLA